MTKRDISVTPSDIITPYAVDILLIDGFALLSHAAAIEPLRAANILAGRELYRWRHLSADGNAVRASNGVALAVDGGCDTGPTAAMVVAVAGGDPSRFAVPRVAGWLRRAARAGATVVGVSGGPWILAQAGLLDGYEATIHWEHQPEFRETFPRVTLRPTLFVIDGTRVTCAGGTAGLDMTVELIARAHGRVLAACVAEWFISTNVREAGGSQRSSLGERYGVASRPLLAALAQMEARIEDPVPRAVLAAQAGVSVRQLERLFDTHLSSTIGRTYLALRLDHAAHLMRTTHLPVAQVAAASGFASTAHFSRAFRTRHGHPPQRLRRAHLAGH